MKENDIVIYKGQIGKIVTFDKAFKFKPCSITESCRYSELDMKVNDFEIQVRKFLKPIIKDVIDEINKELKTNYKYSDVYLKFERSTIINEQETVANEYTKAQQRQIDINNILSLNSILPEEEIRKEICRILELNYEDINWNEVDTFDPDKASEQLLSTEGGENSAE